MKQSKNLRERVWHFTEESTTALATLFRFFIISLILLSAITAFAEIFDPSTLSDFKTFIPYAELGILIIFTLEYLIRAWASPNKKNFLFNTFNVIDLLAIVPFYFGFQNATVLRILRLFRLFRLFRMFKQAKVFQIFQFKGTIVQKLTPLVFTLFTIKAIVWILEVNGWWFGTSETGILFTIIGFALGIILSQKIGTTHGKYLDLERVMFNLHGKISSLAFNINYIKKECGNKIVKKWLHDFLKIYHGPDEHGLRDLRAINERLYQDVAGLGDTKLIPHHRFAAMLRDVFGDSTFILSRKSSYTPGAYDRLLQQVTIIYLFLITIFIPGANGLITVIVASYMLYGMYYVTQDFDLAIGDDKHSLIKLEPYRLENYLTELKSHSK